MLLVRAADDTGDVRGAGDGRSLHVRNTPDAAERARQAVNAGAEERDRSNRGPGKRETLAPVVFFRPPGHARRCRRRAVNSGRTKFWNVDRISGVAEGNSLQAKFLTGRVNTYAEAGRLAVKWDGLQASEQWSWSRGHKKVVNGRHRLLLLLKKYTCRSRA